MKDTSHLVAIMERLSREKARLTASPENPLLAVWVRQTENELAREYEFLGMSRIVECELSEDDLLAELMA